MNIFCAGLNHQTAPLSLREHAAIDDADMAIMLQRVSEIDGLSGAVMLSTCNRTELYASTLCPIQTLHGFHHILQEYSGAVLPLYHHTTPTAVRHLFRVASGLDSMIIGETEIFGQVKKAYALATANGSTTSPLHRLFQHAFRVAKSVRTETQITSGPVSIGSVAVELAEKIFGELATCRVMILGAGEIGERTARTLQARGVRSLIVSNRTYDRAVSLAAEIGGMALHFDHWEKSLANVDIIISATGAADPILTVEKLKPLLKQRQQQPLFVIDLALPRDAEPDINKLPGLFLYDLDSLQQIATESLNIRRQELVRCESMIEEHVATFLKWWKSRNSSDHFPYRVPSRTIIR
jgi:glutamyl-tRNA reductase